MPAEYCEFSPEFEKCKPWLIKNAPELYPQLVKGKIGFSGVGVFSPCAGRIRFCEVLELGFGTRTRSVGFASDLSLGDTM